MNLPTLHVLKLQTTRLVKAHWNSVDLNSLMVPTRAALALSIFLSTMKQFHQKCCRNIFCHRNWFLIRLLWLWCILKWEKAPKIYQGWLEGNKIGYMSGLLIEILWELWTLGSPPWKQNRHFPFPISQKRSHKFLWFSYSHITVYMSRPLVF